MFKIIKRKTKEIQVQKSIVLDLENELKENKNLDITELRRETEEYKSSESKSKFKITHIQLENQKLRKIEKELREDYISLKQRKDLIA